MLELDQRSLTERTAQCFSSKTRDRILETSLILFNEQSFRTVTTAGIAERAAILEGTLWYHFPAKKDILSAHIQLLTTLFNEENTHVDAEDAKTIVLGIFRSYDVIWDFRYILRDDFSAALKNDPDMMDLTQGVNDYLDRWAAERVLHSNKSGVLTLRPENIENTSELILLIGRYWLDFSTKKYPEASQEELRKKGLTHIYNVLEPHLNTKAKSLVSSLLKL